MTESDGINELVEETVRAGASAVVGVQTRRVRDQEQRLHEQRLRDAQLVRQQQADRETERAQALAELSVVDQRAWWETASTADVEHAWQTASRWRDTEPAAHRAAVTLRNEYRQRTGGDLEQENDSRASVAASEHDAAARGEGRPDTAADRRPEGEDVVRDGEGQDVSERLEVAELRAAGFPAPSAAAVRSRSARRATRPARLHTSLDADRERER